MASKLFFMHAHTLSARLLLAALAFGYGSVTQALPTGPQIVNGTAAFNQTGNTLSITNSNNAILNWQQFNIAPSEAVRFNQPTVSSSVLNRVLGGDPSAIYGQLSSNGRVWLINPAGILVGPSARIDTAGFVASTLSLRNEDFLAGKLTFGGSSNNAGSINNQGTITTPDGGSVYLIAPNVTNEGIITTPKGETILAAGQSIKLIDTATPGVNVEVTGAAGNATNLGSIVAEAGRIGVAGVLVRNSGVLNASSVVNQGGRIFLKGTKKIELTDSSRVQANGSKGGNIVAKTEENGQIAGELVARGELSAQGNGSQGSGGFIETSAVKLDVNGAGIATRGGEWLLDPFDFTIAASGGDITGATLGGLLGSNNVTIQTVTGTNTSTNLYATSGTTNGDIFVNDSVAWSTNKLTLLADRNIAINANLTGSNGDISLQALSTGTVTVASGIAVSGQAVELKSSGGAITASGAVTGSTSVNVHAGVGAINTGTTGSITAPAITLQNDPAVVSGAIGSSGTQLRTSSPGGSGNANISIGVSAYGPSAVYLKHSGDATLLSWNAQGSAPIDISATNNLTTNSPINITTTNNLSLYAGNQLTIPASASLTGANVNLVGNLINIDTSSASISAGSGLIHVYPATSSRPMDLGGKAGLANTLELSTAELNRLSGTGTLRLGSLSAGNLTLSAALAPTGGYSASPGILSLESGGTISQGNSSNTITANKLAIKALGDVSLDQASNAVTNLAAQIGDSSHQNHNIRFKNNTGLNIGSGIDGISGISVTLDATSFDSSAQNGVIALTSTAGDLTESASATLAGKAVVVAAKNVLLTESNPTGVIAGTASDGVTASTPAFKYTSASGIVVSNNIDTKSGITFTNGSGLVILDNSGATTVKNISQSTGAIIGGATNTASLVLKSKGFADLSLSNYVTSLAADVGSGLASGSNGLSVKSTQSLSVTTTSLGGVTGINANSAAANLESAATLSVANSVGSSGAIAAGKLALSAPTISLTGYSTSIPAAIAQEGVSVLTNSLTTSQLAAKTTNSVSGIIHVAPFTSGNSVMLGTTGTCPDAACLTLPNSIVSTTTLSAPVIAIGNNQPTWPFDPGGYTRPTTDSIHIAEAFNLSTRTLLLAASGGISQTSSGIITASKLGISVDNSTSLTPTPALNYVDLSTANNSVGTLAANLNTSGESFKFRNAGALTIKESSVYYTTASGSVKYSMSGLSTKGAIELTAAGSLTLNQPIQTTAGNISLGTTGDILSTTSTSGGSSISASGTVNLVAGWDGSSALATPTVVAGTGNITLTDAKIHSGGTMTVSAGNTVAATATTAVAGFDSGGNQTITAKTITLNAGATGHDLYASIIANGTQSISSENITLNGGGSSGSYNNYAAIYQNGTSGSQSFTISGTSSPLSLTGGSGTGAGDTAASGCVTGTLTGCSSNFALIYNAGSGGQSFSFTGASPSVSLSGGSSGVFNDAGIYNNSAGSQTIGSTSNRPSITLIGGNSGGDASGGAEYGGFRFKTANSAVIVSGKADLDSNGAVVTTTAGTQSIYASQVTLKGTPLTGNATGVSGAGLFSASSQTIDVTGALTLYGGDSYDQSRTRLWSMGGTQTINAGSLSVIGASTGSRILNSGDNRATINAWGTLQQLTLGTALTLTGGTGVYNNSAANLLQSGSGSQSITMTGASASISLTGPYVSLGTANSASSPQTITFNNGGSIAVNGANVDTYYLANSGFGSNIGSAGDQTITGATTITLSGGGTSTSAVHDGTATIKANGIQSITAHQITLTGGGSGTSGSTSYNNYASIYQGSSSGSQTITMSGASGSLSLTGGSGMGTGGDYPSACTDCGSTAQSSHNVAEIVNKGGTQTIGFLASGGTITLTGGTLGKYNYASISNDASTLQKIGSSSNLAANYPSISLTGGASGGAWNTVNNVGLRNSAEISTNETGGSQSIQASTITLTGGGDSTTVGGAFIGGGTSQTITTTGNVSLTGGLSNVSTPGQTYNVATAAGIGAKSNISMTLTIGGNLTLTGGVDGNNTTTANSAPAIIGSLNGVATGTVTVSGTQTITSNTAHTPAGSTALINVTAATTTTSTAATTVTTTTLVTTTSTTLAPTIAQCATTPTLSGCSTVLPPLSTCTADPTAAGCSAVLPPLSTCTATPTAQGCSAVLPPLSTCTTTPTAAGCSAVLPPIDTCTTNPATAGCAAVLPPLTTCTTNPAAAGCSAVLPPLSTCTTTPTAAGCSAVLPPLSTCTTNPTAAGCSAVLPPLATCTTTPTAAGCTAVLPPLDACTTNPTTAGCTAVLPPLSTCTTNPTAAGCSAVLPPLSTCTTTPTAAGCSAVLPPLATCTTNPTAAGCSAVLPPISTCTTTPTAAGCSAVLPPLSTCTTNPTAAGCSAVLPPLATCTTTPTAPGCSAVLPALDACTTNPTAAGCSAVLPPLSTCTTNPAAAGCSAVLPPLSTCTTNPTAAGCSAVLPPLSTCTTNPTAAGCSAVLPPLSTCTTTPNAAGCSAVLPPLSSCTTNPTAAGCSAVLPPLSACTTNPTAAGCSAVLPPISTCTTTPTAAGCSAVLPPLSTCTTNPTAAGCSAVLPPIANCTTNPSLAGCTAVLPSVANCSTDPGLPGCTVVLPPAAPVAQAVVAKEVISVTTNASKPADQASAAPPPPPPPPAPIVTTTGPSSLTLLKTNQTIGGTEGTFGGTPTPSISATQVTASLGTSGTASSTLGASSSSFGTASTAPASSTTPASSTSGTSTAGGTSGSSGSSSGSATSSAGGNATSSTSGAGSEADKPAESKPADKPAESKPADKASSDDKKEEKKDDKKDKEDKKEDTAKKQDDKPASKKPAVCS